MTACCDTCGKSYVEGDDLYSIATKMDDQGNLVKFRHWKCNETNGPFVQLGRAVREVQAKADIIQQDIRARRADPWENKK